jgi:hypothetical protein
MLMTVGCTVPEGSSAQEAYDEHLAEAGLGYPIGSVWRVPDAYGEAQWTLEGAKATGKSVARTTTGHATHA